MQQLVIKTFSSVTQRPSAEKEWQHPAREDEVLPMNPFFEVRVPPLDVQAASYFAASVRMVSFSKTSIWQEERISEPWPDGETGGQDVRSYRLHETAERTGK